MPTLKVQLCDIFACSKKNCHPFVDVTKFTKLCYLSDKLKKLNKKLTKNVYQKKNLEVHLCDIFICSENCFSFDVIKYAKASQEQLRDKPRVQLCDIFTGSKKNCHPFVDVTKFTKPCYLSNKFKILNKKLTQNVYQKNLEVHLCDIFTCSENCFSFDITKYAKASQVQLSDKPKNFNRKLHFSKFRKYNKPENCNENTERENHSTSTKIKRTCYLEADSESESSYGIESIYSEVEYDYEPFSDEEKEENDESDYESLTETETETETESNSDTESTYCAVSDHEYVPMFEEAEKIVESYSESDSETEVESYSESDSETEDNSYSEEDTETKSMSSSKSNTKTGNISDFGSDTETERNFGLRKGRTLRFDTDRKRKLLNKRVSQKKKLRRWRLKSLMEN